MVIISIKGDLEIVLSMRLAQKTQAFSSMIFYSRLKGENTYGNVHKQFSLENVK